VSSGILDQQICGTAKIKGGNNDHTIAGRVSSLLLTERRRKTTNLVNVTKVCVGNDFFEIYTFTDSGISGCDITITSNGLRVQGLMDTFQAGSYGVLFVYLHERHRRRCER